MRDIKYISYKARFQNNILSSCKDGQFKVSSSDRLLESVQMHLQISVSRFQGYLTCPIWRSESKVMNFLSSALQFRGTSFQHRLNGFETPRQSPIRIETPQTTLQGSESLFFSNLNHPIWTSGSKVMGFILKQPILEILLQLGLG